MNESKIFHIFFNAYSNIHFATYLLNIYILKNIFNYNITYLLTLIKHYLF